jgi:hypothetical protein
MSFEEVILLRALCGYVACRTIDRVVRRDFKKLAVSFFSFNVATRDAALALAFEIISDSQHGLSDFIGYYSMFPARLFLAANESTQWRAQTQTCRNHEVKDIDVSNRCLKVCLEDLPNFSYGMDSILSCRYTGLFDSGSKSRLLR